MEFGYHEIPTETSTEALQMNEVSVEASTEATTEASGSIQQTLMNDVQSNRMDVLETPNVMELPYVETIVDWKPEIRYDVPGTSAALVSGNPYDVAPYLDSHQGDTGLRAAGTCGLTSISNVCVMAGMDVTEADVVKFALDNNLCSNGFWKSADEIGGTNYQQRIEILKAYGIDATAYSALEDGGSLENIANAVEDGKGVIMGLNAGILWDEPSAVGGSYGITPSNHCVTITGVARDASNGEVVGFYICDSGRCMDTDASRYLTVDELSKAYNANIINANVVITDQPIRKI